LTSNFLVRKEKDEDYAENLSKVDSVAYLLKKEAFGNRNAPQCIVNRCNNLIPTPYVTPEAEDSIPFKIELEILNPAEFEKAESPKDTIRLNLSLVFYKF